MSPRSPREISVLVPPDLAPLYPDDPVRVGPYLVIGRLGQGDAGTVYAAIDPARAEDPLVALKVLNAAELDSTAAYEVLRERLQALSAVDPRHCVVPIAFDADAAPAWLAMPYVSGVRLSHYVSKRGGLGTGKLVALAAGLAEGLAALHARNVPHGDLTPGNILLGADGPVILECAVPRGASRLRGGAATWISPERHRGGPPSVAADVFAWGAIIAFAGMGRLPFGSGEPEEIVERIAAGEPDLSGMPAPLVPLVRRALAGEAAERPSVRELMGAAIAVWEAESLDPQDPRSAHGTELPQILAREWHGIVPPARIPEVIRLEGRVAARRPARLLFALGTGVAALALIGGGAWGAVSVLGGPEPEGEELMATEPEEVEDDGEDGEELTLTVRFDPAEQENPAEGPWTYTPVEPAGDLGSGAGEPTHEEWAQRWTEAGEPAEVVIAPDAEVLCAKFCAAPGHVFLDEEGRGTWELTGGDYVQYLSWGPVMIVEVTLDGDDEGSPRKVVQVTELFTN